MIRLSRTLLLSTLAVVVIFVLAGALAFRAAPVAAPPSAAAAAAQAASLTVAGLSDATTAAAATASPSVVLIRSSSGLGSGEIVDKRGYIVTNYHVLFGEGNAASPSASYTVTLANGTSYTASIAGTDRPDDLAMLKISAPNLRAIQMADSNKVQVGQFVLAVGNPLGFSQTVTFGIISTLRRTVSEGGQPAVFIPDMLQTSAPINPGNSGGALVDLQGRLVGVPTLAAADPQQGTAAQGIGFAIPRNRVKFISQQIIAHGRVVHSGRPYLGVANTSQVTPALAAQYGLGADNGVVIGAVVPNGPAAKAGVRGGDVVVELNKQPTLSVEAFNEALARLKPGQRVTMTVVTGSGQHRSVTLTLGELPVEP